jgi:hypothetical protein
MKHLTSLAVLCLLTTAALASDRVYLRNINLSSKMSMNQDVTHLLNLGEDGGMVALRHYQAGINQTVTRYW